MTAKEKILHAGFEDVVLLSNYSYDDALIGVTIDGRAVYDCVKMITWLMSEENWSFEEAEEWISYNTMRALPYMGDKAPLIMFSLQHMLEGGEINDD